MSTAEEYYCRENKSAKEDFGRNYTAIEPYERAPSLWKDQGKDYVAQYKARENKRRTSGLAAMLLLQVDSNTLETDWHVLSPYDIIIIAIINSVIIITVIVIIIVNVITVIIITRTNYIYYCFYVSVNTCL